MSAVLLLRHGQEASARDLPNGGGLSSLGQRQAALTAERLRDEVSLRRIVSSTLTRAVETAEFVQKVFPRLSLEKTDALRECIPNVPPHLAETFPRVSGDALQRNQARLEGVFETYFSAPPEGTVLLVCHGNVIRYLVARTLGLHRTGWMGMDIQNAGLCRISWHKSFGRQLTGFNDVGHLPAATRTFY